MHFLRACMLWLSFFACVIAGVAPQSASAEDKIAYKLPQFRQVQADAQMPAFPDGTTLKLLTDADFPPYSFQARSGLPAGIAVEVAASACAEMKVACEFVLKPLPELLPALAAGEGDAILMGPSLAEATTGGALVTRPWFRTMARIAVKTGSPIKETSAAELAGKRIACIKNSAQEKFLQTYFGQSELVCFDSEAEAMDALKNDKADLLFGDDLGLIYWVSGTGSQACCRLLPGAYSDLDSFSRNLAFIVRSDRDDVRQAFDVALDRMQGNGATEKIFNAYVPLSPW
jgi:polar amino acid transport system substrate-binding protein